MAYEIDKFYELNISRYSLDWGKLTSRRELDKLSIKNEVLAKLLGEYRNNFCTATCYRNRLTHDGIIRVEADVHLSGVSIMLAEDCNNDTSPMNVDAVSFCEDKKEEVLTLLDESYKLMLKDYENSREGS